MAPPRVLLMSLPHTILWVGAVKPNLHHHSIIPQSTQSSSSSSSGSGSRSGSASGSSASGSSRLIRIRIPCWVSCQLPGACSDTSGSQGSTHSCSASLEIVSVHNDDEDTTAHSEEDVPHSDDEANLSQGTLSLPDISASNDEDARKAIVRETTQKSDVQYSNW